MTTQLWLWGGFTLFILAMLALDLGVFQRRPHVISTKEAMRWFGFWTGLALLFNLGILLFHERGGQAGLEFFTGFLVEKSLSIDNVFVFILIFGYFSVPKTYQHKVLFWGIVGAIVLRAGFILGGLALMERFHWTLYVFGTFLLVTGVLMMRKKEAVYDPGKNWVIRTFRRFFPVTDRYDGNRFFTRKDGRLWATPLFIVLLAVESSDIIFAVDSIPAIFAITSDPFIVYTSNIFAMLGLRALYFAVAGFMQMFHFLHYGFASIIIILGTKMLLSDVYKLPLGISVTLIVVILLLCVIVSLLRPRRADLKMMFQRTESLGLIPFRRLLLIENIIDMGDLKVRDAMRRCGGVRTVQLALPWEQNLKLISDTHYSRYPVMTPEADKPVGVLHVKNIPFAEPAAQMTPDRLKALARPPLEMGEDLPLEEALALFQRHYRKMAIVTDAAGQWTGIISNEDVLEEIVGRIGDEFDAARSEASIQLADALSPERVILELQATSMPQAIERIIAAVPAADFPAEAAVIIHAVQEREQAMPTYLGKGLAIPHGRLDKLEKPMLIFARCAEGIPQTETTERADLIFLLLTPTGMARVQPRLLADIVGLIDSDYVTERLRKATTPEEIIEAIRAGQQVVLD
ncbi:MAG: TerC/Alx family metal homeostasis membrane protein [Verrucomicrobia bacterium]|nr:TerC/Alx family metal homeostasis membrane protein [Verrucomicrobiota bacterium]